MNLKPIIVKEYLESLTEKNELNRIFPLLLESMNFTILSKPSEKLGLKEYGKDIVAIGNEDGIRKRYYFELKGGSDRNITEATIRKQDGISDSLLEATYVDFVSAYPKFEDLSLKVVIVHNGTAKGNAQELLDNLFNKLAKNSSGVEFDRWDLSRLTHLFSENLFGAHLLTDETSTKLFNRTLVNLNTSTGVSKDFIELLDYLLNRKEWKVYKNTISRKWRLLFESVKLISFVINTESHKFNNLDIAKRYNTHLIISFWHWILKNNLERDKKVMIYFNQTLVLYISILQEYLKRTYPFARLNNGLYSTQGGRYEQVGYNLRAFDYLHILLITIKVEAEILGEKNRRGVLNLINELIANNMVLCKPLLDIHSIPIMECLNLLIKYEDYNNAKIYLRNIFWYIQKSKQHYGSLPDANNSKENVIRLLLTGEKSIFYSDKTSPLLAALIEYAVILDMEEEYLELREFIKSTDIHLGLFVPSHGTKSKAEHVIEDNRGDLEEQLFSRSVTVGYQSEVAIKKELYDDLTFEEFKSKLEKRKSEFTYEYRTKSIGYSFLLDMAHYYYQTPFFPDKWRRFLS